MRAVVRCVCIYIYGALFALALPQILAYKFGSTLTHWPQFFRYCDVIPNEIERDRQPVSCTHSMHCTALTLLLWNSKRFCCMPVYCALGTQQHFFFNIRGVRFKIVSDFVVLFNVSAQSESVCVCVCVIRLYPIFCVQFFSDVQALFANASIHKGCTYMHLDVVAEI